jgi:hypothetical protein
VLSARTIAVLTGLVLTLAPVALRAQAAVPVGPRAADARLWGRDGVPNASGLEARPLTGRRAARGLFVGAILGAAAGALVGYALCDKCDDGAPLIYTAGIGAAIGAVVGLVVEGNRASSAASPRPASASLARNPMRALLPNGSLKLPARPASLLPAW